MDKFSWTDSEGFDKNENVLYFFKELFKYKKIIRIKW